MAEGNIGPRKKCVSVQLTRVWGITYQELYPGTVESSQRFGKILRHHAAQKLQKMRGLPSICSCSSVGGGLLFPRALGLRLMVSTAVFECPSICFYSLRVSWRSYVGLGEKVATAALNAGEDSPCSLLSRTDWRFIYPERELTGGNSFPPPVFFIREGVNYP